MKKIVALSLLIAVAAIIAAMRFWPSRHEAVFYPMGGIPFRVIAYDRSDFSFKDDVKAAENLVEKLEGVFNSHRDSSEVSRINREAHNGPLEMSADMRRVIESAIEWWKKSDGAFDITVGPLIRLWSEAVEKGILPSEKQIKDAKVYVGMDKFSPPLPALSVVEGTGGDKGEGDRSPPPLLPPQGAVSEVVAAPFRVRNLRRLKPAATKVLHLVTSETASQGGGKFEIGLGGIAKGDIVDQVAAFLKTRGVKRGVIDAGGDTLAFGDGTFRFGVQDPTAKSGEALIGEIEIPAGAIVTSGNYERFVEIGGKKYSHIIDPKTGMPVDNGLIAVTVAGGKCIDADALATALMVLGRERAIDFLSGKFSPSPSPPPIPSTSLRAGEGGGETYKAILVEKNNDEYIVWVQDELISKVHFEGPWGRWVQTF